MRQVPTRTIIFLFTDVEGLTRLLAEHANRHGDLFVEHRRLVRGPMRP
jgi:hypothetical protein